MAIVQRGAFELTAGGGDIGPTKQQALQLITGEAGVGEKLHRMGRVAQLLDDPKEYYRQKVAKLASTLSGQDLNNVDLAGLKKRIEEGTHDGNALNDDATNSLFANVQTEYNALFTEFKKGGVSDAAADSLARPIIVAKIQSQLTALNMQFPKSDELTNIDSIVRNITNK